MKIILLDNIEKLGGKYEIKDVADGYARNFLIPRKLAKLADENSIKWAGEMEKEREEKAKEELEKIGEIVSKIDGEEIEIPVKVGEKDQLFKKISEKDIIKALKEEIDYELKKDQVKLEEPIGKLGEYPIKIKFGHNLEAEIKIIVIEGGGGDQETAEEE